MLSVKKICGDNDGMMVTVSRKMAKILTVSRKMAKILTVSRKSHHLLRPSFPEKASATPPLPIPPLPPHFPYSFVQFSFLITATAYSKRCRNNCNTKWYQKYRSYTQSYIATISMHEI